MMRALSILIFAAAFVCAGQSAALAQKQDESAPVPLVEPKLDPNSPNLLVLNLGDAQATKAQTKPAKKPKKKKGFPEILPPMPTFDFGGHEEANKSLLLKNQYMRELHRAMVRQDIVRQVSSKAHFDNCAFEEGMSYIDQLLKSVNDTMAQAQRDSDAGRNKALETDIADAFFTLGQALHGIQDFYAHSNYVEMMKEAHHNFEDVPVVPLWTEEGRQRVRELRRGDLVSGTWTLGLPWNCRAGTPSHSQLAKDDATTDSGKVNVPQWRNINQYQAALLLATKASADFIRYAYGRWPLLKRVAGGDVAVEVIQERRRQ